MKIAQRTKNSPKRVNGLPVIDDSFFSTAEIHTAIDRLQRAATTDFSKYRRRNFQAHAPLAKFVPLATLAAVLFVVAYNVSEWREIGGIFRTEIADVLVWLVEFFFDSGSRFDRCR
jgi:hypothetical protein